jgi:hypothetical protein
LNPNAIPFIPNHNQLGLHPPEVGPALSPSQITARRWRELFNFSHDYRLTFQQQERTPANLSDLNLTQNIPWGDTMTHPKSQNTFRIYCQNINGLKLDAKGGDLNRISAFVHEYQCDMIAFSEINLDVSKYQVCKIIDDTIGRSFDANKYAMSTSKIPFEGFYKPGGTLTAIFKHNVCRFQSKFSDSMGR